MSKAYWLIKSEPDVYAIEDLEREGPRIGKACAIIKRATFCAIK